MCIPIIFGCPTKTKPEGGEATHLLCPNCHNHAVIRAKRTTWFELFWIPLIPLQWKHVWVCTICQWSQKAEKRQDTMNPGQNATAEAALPATTVYTPQRQPGYQPAYIGPNSQPGGGTKA